MLKGNAANLPSLSHDLDCTHTQPHTHCKIYLCKKVEKTLSGRKVCDLFLRSMRKMCEFESINYRQPNTEFNPGTNIPPYIYHLCAWLCVAYNLGHTHMYTVHTHTYIQDSNFYGQKRKCMHSTCVRNW